MTDLRLNLSLSTKTAKILNAMADEYDSSKSDVIRWALTLLLAAMQHKKKNHRVAFIDENDKVISEVVGLLND